MASILHLISVNWLISSFSKHTVYMISRHFAKLEQKLTLLHWRLWPKFPAETPVMSTLLSCTPAHLDGSQMWCTWSLWSPGHAETSHYTHLPPPAQSIILHYSLLNFYADNFHTDFPVLNVLETLSSSSSFPRESCGGHSGWRRQCWLHYNSTQ